MAGNGNGAGGAMSAGSGAGSETTASLQDAPWANDAEAATACDLATRNLSNNLLRMVKTEKGVQAETYLCAAGLIAGYAAQRSLTAAGETEGLQVVTLESGKRFLFGEPLNQSLFARTAQDAQGRVVNIALGTASHLGAKIAMDDVEPMFEHVSRTISKGQPFYPSPPNRPLVDGDALLRHVWPRVLNILKADFDETHRRAGPVPERWWAAVCARPVSQVMREVKDGLDPRIAATLVLESAIFGSKVTAPEKTADA